MSEKVAVITCAVLELELAHLARDLSHVVHIEVLEQGLHNEPDRLRRELQAAISRVENNTSAEVIVLGYGLCSRGTEGVITRRCRLVIARAHDCITHLLGSKERYAAYLAAHPGTYWYSPGWNKHHTPPGRELHEQLRRLYIEKYGDDNAEYLMEMEQGWFKEYSNAAHIDQSLIDDTHYKDFTKKAADWLHWKYEELPADNSLFEDFLEGRWDNDRFLVLEPGETIQPSHDDAVLRKDPAPSAAPAVDATPAPAPDAATAES